MKLRVTGEHIFVRPEAQPTTSDAGLTLVYDRQASTMTGTVVAVGSGPVTAKGVVLPHFVEVGHRVLFSPDAGQETIFEKETLLCLREWDVLARIEG